MPWPGRRDTRGPASAVRQGPSVGRSGGGAGCSGDGRGGAGALPADRSGTGDDVPAHPRLAARRLLGRIAERCSGELSALPCQSAAPSPLLAETPGTVPCLRSSPGRGVQATLPGRGGGPPGETGWGGGGWVTHGDTRPPPGGARRRQRPGRHVGAGGLQHRGRGQRPAGRRSAVQHRPGGQRRRRRRPLSRLAGPVAPPRPDKAAPRRRRARRSAGGDPWSASLAALGHGGEGEVRRAGPRTPCPAPHLGASSLRGTSDASGDE